MQRLQNSHDDWTIRLSALQNLGQLFETFRHEHKSRPQLITPEIWNTLKPLKGSIHDLRSQIVKETCSVLIVIADTTRDAMEIFLRAMLPSLLEVCGSGNKLCGSHCCACIYAIVSCTVVRGGNLKFFVDTLQETKNTAIRFCCIKSLRLITEMWSSLLDRQDVHMLERALKLALYDASETCRNESYAWFEVFQGTFQKRAQFLLTLLDYKIQNRLKAVIQPKAALARAQSAVESIAAGHMHSRRGERSFTLDEEIPAFLDLELGDRVCVPASELFGVVRYLGAIDNVRGSWVGIELDEARGKNDGSLNAKRYFTCAPGHGIFVRKQQVFLTIAKNSEKQDQCDVMAPSSPKSIGSEVKALESVPAHVLESSKPDTETVEEDAAMLSPLHSILQSNFLEHRRYVNKLVEILHSELIEHHRFEQVAATASSADVIQYLQQLTNTTREKIALSDSFIETLVQTQQAAMEC